jgi:tRNA uridine 5-carbamoylmethylation protein Kti12
VPQLIVVTGPIASGKSAVASLLADALSDKSRTAVVSDLDDVVASTRAPSGEALRTWQRAREIHGRIIGEWLSSDVDYVIADGPFYSEWETDLLMRWAPAETSVHRILLLASYEVALERVVVDPSRGISKDPGILRVKYDEFYQQLEGTFEWTFNTTDGDLALIVATVSRGILGLESS